MSLTANFAPEKFQQKVFAIGSTSFRMITLPGKEDFWMGSADEDKGAKDSEKPRHQRDIAPFALAEFPVTQQLWQEVVARARVQRVLSKQALPLQPSYFQGANRPVENVSWFQAQKFCEVLSMLTIGRADFFRLPSEAEWEFAARGRTETLYAGSSYLPEVGWYYENNCLETIPVGLLGSNAFGLYEMSGNVCEWCEDDWKHDYKDHPLNSEPWRNYPNDNFRDSNCLQRGGSWYNDSKFSRCANRDYLRPNERDRFGGFRLAGPVQL